MGYMNAAVSPACPFSILCTGLKSLNAHTLSPGHSFSYGTVRNMQEEVDAVSQHKHPVQARRSSSKECKLGYREPIRFSSLSLFLINEGDNNICRVYAAWKEMIRLVGYPVSMFIM